MKIIIDARMISWPGIGRYTEKLLHYLERINDENNYVVLMLPSDVKTWQPTNHRFKVIYADIRPYGLSEQVKLPLLLKRLQPDLVHFTHFTVPLAFRGEYVVTIHDLVLLRYQNLRGGLFHRSKYRFKQVIMGFAIRSAAQRADVIITDSQFVKDDIVTTLSVDAKKIAVIPLAAELVSPCPELGDNFHIEDNYILHVGSFFPYKNIRRLIDAFTLLAPQNPDLKLALVGKVDSFANALRQHAVDQGIVGRIVFVDYVPNDQLAWFYQHARAYVFPSLSEGFGLPGLEAMTQGTPVLAARASCLPEVFADAAYYFDPLDSGDMAAKIGEVLNSPKLRQQLSAAGAERVKDFSWRRTAEQTHAVYRKSTDVRI
jgi:glycosyltransferase involved in cell wall biosynthesis